MSTMRHTMRADLSLLLYSPTAAALQSGAACVVLAAPRYCSVQPPPRPCNTQHGRMRTRQLELCCCKHRSEQRLKAKGKGEGVNLAVCHTETDCAFPASA